MNDKKIYLALAVIFTGMAIYAQAWPVFILGAIYFYVFFTHDGRQRKKEEESKTQKFTSNETLSKREPMDLALIDKVPWYKKLYKKIFKFF